MSSPESVEALATSSYWNQRYAGVGPAEQVHEWFKSFSELEPFLNQYFFQVRGPETAPKIIHLGSGDSVILELAARGYQSQLCVDFSSVVVEAMQQKHSQVGGITWIKLDIRQMDPISSESIDIAFDKATLDVMIYGSPWTPPDEVVENTSRYMREVFRILHPDGVFLYITYRQPHFVRPLLECNGTAWNIEVAKLSNAGSFDYYGFILKKAGSTGPET